VIIALDRIIHHRNVACLKPSALSSPCPFQDTVQPISDLRMCEYYRYFKHLFSSKPLFGNLVPRINKGGVLDHLYSFFLNTDHSNSSKRHDPQFASSTTSAKMGQEVRVFSIQLMLGLATPTTKPVHE